MDEAQLPWLSSVSNHRVPPDQLQLEQEPGHAHKALFARPRIHILCEVLRDENVNKCIFKINVALTPAAL